MGYNGNNSNSRRDERDRPFGTAPSQRAVVWWNTAGRPGWCHPGAAPPKGKTFLQAVPVALRYQGTRAAMGHPMAMRVVPRKSGFRLSWGTGAARAVLLFRRAGTSLKGANKHAEHHHPQNRRPQGKARQRHGAGLRQPLHRPHVPDGLHPRAGLARRPDRPLRSPDPGPGGLRPALWPGLLRGPEGLPGPGRQGPPLPAGLQRPPHDAEHAPHVHAGDPGGGLRPGHPHPLPGGGGLGPR